MTDDFREWETDIPWSPLHLLPLVWFDPSFVGPPIVGRGVVVQWNDKSGPDTGETQA